MSALGITFDDERDLAYYLGITTSELPKLGVLLDRFTPGQPLGPADLSVLKGQARFIVQQRNLNPPKLPEYPRDLRFYKGGF